MKNIGQAIALGLEILTDVALCVAGQQTSFNFHWHGRTFTVTLSPQ